MATAPEVFALERLHQAAQARLGIAAAFLSLAEWEQVTATSAQATSAAWLEASLLTIVAAGKLSSQLAIAYYRLARALETGRTLGGTGEIIALSTLRRDFRDLTIDIAALPPPPPPSHYPHTPVFQKKQGGERE